MRRLICSAVSVSRQLARQRKPRCCNALSTAATPKLKIIFGSQTGTAEAFAYDLEFDASETVDTEILDAQDVSLADLLGAGRGTVHAFIVAVYGEGAPTDNAKRLYDEIVASPQANFSHCRYAVFGLGNSHCFQDRFNVVGKDLDERLWRQGGQRIMPIGLGDASKDLSGAFASWKTDLLSRLQEEAGSAMAPPSPAQASTTATTTTSSSSSTTLDAKPACCATAASASCSLTGAGLSMHGGPADQRSGVFSPSKGVPLALSARQLAMAPAGRPIVAAKLAGLRQMFSKTDELTSSVEVTFDVSSAVPLRHDDVLQGPITSGLRAGDHIGVFPAQASYVVGAFAAAADIDASQMEAPFGDDAAAGPTLRQVLTWQTQLTGLVPPTAIKVLHRWASENSLANTAAELKRLSDNYDEMVRAHRLDISVVLRMIPRGPAFPPLPLQALLKVLPSIVPRQYSLTSNPQTDPSHPSLLCRLLRFRDEQGGIISGLCSSYLAERLHVQDQVAIFFRESAFHLPDGAQPVIMICGGTGIAPFISFLKERSRRLQTTPAVLYYGCRSPDEYIYREELLHHLRDSSLSKLVVSFSSSSTGGDIAELMVGRHSNEIIRPFVENITDAVREDNELLRKYVYDGAYVYVCGGAGNFGKAVRESVECFSSASDNSTGIRMLIDEKRYFEDLAD